MANYIKKFTLTENNVSNTDVENAILVARNLANPLNINFKELVNDSTIMLPSGSTLPIDTNIYLSINNQYINICIIQDLPDLPTLSRQNGNLISRVISGRASATFMVYNTRTLFGSYAQHQESLNLYKINQVISRLVKYSSVSYRTQEIFSPVINFTDAQNYIIQHAQQVKKIIIDITQDEALFNFDDFEPLRNQNIRYLQEIDLSLFHDDIRGLIKYLTNKQLWQRVSKIFCLTDQGNDRMVNLANDVKESPDNFDNAKCIKDLAKFASEHPDLHGFEKMDIFTTLRNMSNISNR